jgi:hypothetical protein
MNWLNLWIGTFLKKQKIKYTFEEGVKSVVFSSVIIGVLSFLSALLVQNTVLLNAFFSDIILMPALIFVGAVAFIGVFRWAAKKHNGRGNFKTDFAAFGLYLGSMIFATGILMFVMALLSGMIVLVLASNANSAEAIIMLMSLVLLVISALMIYLMSVLLGVLLEELAAVEKLSIFSTAKAIGIAVAVIFIIIVVASVMVALLSPAAVDTSALTTLG